MSDHTATWLLAMSVATPMLAIVLLFETTSAF